MSAHESAELVNNTVDQSETVVLGHNLEEVLDCLVGVGALDDLSNDAGLVFSGESRGRKNGAKLLVLGEGGLELLEGLIGALEAGGLRAGGVLKAGVWWSAVVMRRVRGVLSRDNTLDGDE